MTVSPAAVSPRSFILDEVIDLSIELEFVDAENQIVDDPPAVDDLAASLVSPTGVAAPLNVAEAEGGETVTVSASGPVTFDEAGIWMIFLSEDGQGRMPGVPIVVDDPTTGWLTIDAARRVEWPDSPSDDATLYELLQASRDQCIDYAPALPLGTAVPARWRQAQLKQARAIWADLQTNGEPTNPDGIGVTVYTMSVHVQQLLRPKQGRPRIR